MPERQNIYLKIFDITGRKVLDLYKGYLEKGEHFLPLNISSDGVYFIFLKGKNKEVKKFFKIRR
ncbi:MAG: T9SS type A sorting domain-containing protein [candidate division WOR-3 bacterium]